MTTARRALRAAMLMTRIAAGVVALARLARAASVAAPVRATVTPLDSISVVVPARNEVARIGPLLSAVMSAPGVDEIVVVDDQSSDGTADVARSHGATVIAGAPLPDGWAGKAWALQQGLDAATSDWVVTLDADARPNPLLPTALVARAAGDHLDFVTVAGRFDCPTAPGRWLHAAMLTTLVYRFGPPGSVPRDPGRTMANGQCMAARRLPLVEAGGMSSVAGHVVEDVALARSLATAGWSVGFLDASDLLDVRMFESFADTWRGWSRSLALPGVELRSRQLVDLVVVLLAQAVPIPRLVFGRGDPVDVILALGRVGTLIGTRRAYARTDAAYWLSPLADPLAALALAGGIGRRGRQTWRGRTYGRR